MVECRSDYEYAQRPLAFTWHGERYLVSQILNTWRTPNEKFFQVSTTDGSAFTLIYLESDDQWSVELYQLSTNLAPHKENS
jgi:hypothetical protein